MNKQFTDNGWDDYLWYQTHDKKGLKRLNKLIIEASRTPFTGIGKPEALHGDYSGFWSRRVDEKNRLIYGVENDLIIILACRTHYGK